VLTVATCVDDELQLTAFVIVCVVPSLYVPVAVSPSVDAGASTALVGVTEIETSVAELTVNNVDPVTPSRVALMFAVPGATPVTRLTEPTVATAVLSEAQVASRVIFCVVESLKVPVAPNDSFVPGAIVLPTGVTEMETRVAFDTVSVIDALIEPTVAVIVVVPGDSPFASPLLVPIFATPVFDDVQVACVVRSCVLPSLKVPIAENCRLVVGAIVESPGWIARDAKSAAFTVTVTLPLTAPDAAVITVVPRLRAVPIPLVVIDITLCFDELHVTVPVMSCTVPSENVPVAVNCCRVPSGTEGSVGVTTIEVTVAPVTVSVVLEETLPEVAEISEVPAVNPIASPEAPFTLMLAVEGLPDVHCTDPVTFC